jgi:hypothetical protein
MFIVAQSVRALVGLAAMRWFFAASNACAQKATMEPAP